MKCKGHRNRGKGHLELTKDAKKEPYKKGLPPKTLGHKNPSKTQ
jgi:hypothetical protein